ncbi:hypothetical protein V8D89_008219 [Ganoderma adspersum]
MSFPHILDKYKIPRESVDIEALAQGLAYYFKITAEDTQFLSKHIARHDELFAEFYKLPGVKPSVAACEFVPLGGDPDTHLVPANAQIERLTPPKMIEDRVARLHVAFAALMVYNQYKVMYPLFDHRDLQLQVDRWNAQIRGFQAPPPSACHTPPTPPRHLGDPKRVSDDEAEHFLRNSSTLIGTRFVHSPPQEQDHGYDEGPWKIMSYTVREGDEGVEHEYQVLLEALEGTPLPMDEGEVRYLLQYSTFAQ